MTTLRTVITSYALALFIPLQSFSLSAKTPLTIAGGILSASVAVAATSVATVTARNIALKHIYGIRSFGPHEHSPLICISALTTAIPSTFLALNAFKSIRGLTCKKKK